ncbi:MAG TPA: hypothetical protein VFY10_06965 [Dehalococcoidia bacterium]|nr:hypothetical protein [Dehalococcoidia bacterium]
MQGFAFVTVLTLGLTLIGLRSGRATGKVGPLVLGVLLLAGAWYVLG